MSEPLTSTCRGESQAHSALSTNHSCRGDRCNWEHDVTDVLWTDLQRCVSPILANKTPVPGSDRQGPSLTLPVSGRMVSHHSALVAFSRRTRDRANATTDLVEGIRPDLGASVRVHGFLPHRRETTGGIELDDGADARLSSVSLPRSAPARNVRVSTPMLPQMCPFDTDQGRGCSRFGPRRVSKRIKAP